LKGTSRWGESIPILSGASKVRATWNGPSKLERLAAKGLRGPIERRQALGGRRRRRVVVDSGEKVCGIHVRRPVNAARGVATKTRNSRCYSGAGCTIPGIQIVLVVAREESCGSIGGRQISGYVIVYERMATKRGRGSERVGCTVANRRNCASRRTHVHPPFARRANHILTAFRPDRLDIPE